MARPKKPIDPIQIQKMAERGNNVQDIAHILGVDRRSLQRYYAADIEIGKAKLVDALKSQLIRRAFDRVKPSDSCLVFALKNFADMSDKVEQRTTAEIKGDVTYVTEWGAVSSGKSSDEAGET
ncbi:MAG: hypothetical protein BWZ03_00133 [bacterium ADurb.BinA186]|nr:MAG: hypothetical protein BWZ03_00133 [bacterium ADurb.BinA186]